jgi:hypothetical protein
MAAHAEDLTFPDAFKRAARAKSAGSGFVRATSSRVASAENRRATPRRSRWAAHPSARGRRCHRQAQPAPLRQVEQVERSGEEGLVIGQRLLARPELAVEGRPVERSADLRVERRPRIPGRGRGADQREPAVERELGAMRAVELLPDVQHQGLGVHQQAVEVEHQGSDHGRGS